MRNYFLFGGIDSRDFGVYISGSGVFDAPKRIYNEVVIPGKSGTLLIDTKAFENISVTYPAFIPAGNFQTNLSNFRAALLSQIGYKPLVDSYSPGETRYGCFMDEIVIKTAPFLQAGQFDITFNCKPQRFLDSGNTAITLSESTRVNNPTAFPSKPIIKVTGYGSFWMPSDDGSDIFIVENIYDAITIDCETGNAITDMYDNANDAFTIPINGALPRLRPGENYISIDSTITEMEIIPRWYTL